MSLLQLLAGGASAPKLYSSDVFSAYTYTGNGSTQTITNGIDLAGKGGLVWIKNRDVSGNHALYDTLRGVSASLSTNATSPSYYSANTELTAFTSSGFDVVNAAYNQGVNYNDKYASWTFCKAPKFFDCGTYTGTGVTQTINHSLGITPGMIIVKATSAGGYGWAVFHRSLSANYTLNLSTTAAEANTGYFGSVGASSFDVATGAALTNDNGVSYVWYAFAHDTTADGIIQCGSFTTDGSGNATVTLGFEPQYMMVKPTSTTGNWEVIDTMRGWSVGTTDARVYPNLSDAENSGTQRGYPTATGFTTESNFGVSTTYAYMVIRRPNKPPTVGTQVYNAIARTGTGAAATVTGVGFAPDWIPTQCRSTGYIHNMYDRLRGASIGLDAAATTAETTVAGGGVNVFGMDGCSFGTGQPNVSGETYINHFFRRAPGVFDQVCYTGTGVAKTEAHNLGVVPELMIVKRRSGARNWCVYNKTISATSFLVLNLDQQSYSDAGNWNDTEPTASVFTLGADFNANGNGSTYVAYLFATKAGISKVGSYTGNGSNQTINCGFTTGARFFLVKATSTTGSWWVYDSTRGIVSGNDPALALNSTAAEVTSADAVDPDASGIIVNEEATCSINANGISYIFLALA